MAKKELPKYGFMPWARKGLGNMIAETDAINDSSAIAGRPQIKISAAITDGASRVLNSNFQKEVNLVGPGDIIGFNSNSIIKNEPATGRLNNFERNYFPYVEFYEEDFPWRFSPGKSINHKLTPWFTLVVLKNDGSEFKRHQNIVGHFPSIEIIDESILPSPDDLWAWAHVQYTGDLVPSQTLSGEVNNGHKAKSKLTDALSKNPDVACSRIICPRLLEPNTEYTGFLLPTYEAGRLAGLGDFDGIDTINSQLSSYQSGMPKAGLYPELFPVYFEWDFVTGEIGDFEELVRMLKPKVADKDVGVRPMYIGKPGYGVEYDKNFTGEKTLGLEGALQVPNNSRINYPWSNSTKYRSKLSQFISLSEDLLEGTFSSGNHYLKNVFSKDQNESIEDDPIITADLYGRYHALKNRVNTNERNWVSELNLDPRNRAVAGMGAEYVRQNQENLVDKAWQQLGEVMEANRKIDWGQLALAASSRGFEKNIEKLPEERQIALMGGLLSRVRLGGDQLTAMGELNKSALPNASVSNAYRKLERPGGPLMKRIANKEATQIRSQLATNKIKLTSVKEVSSQLSFVANSDLNNQIKAIQTQNVRSESANINLMVAKDVEEGFVAAKLNAFGSLMFTQAYANFNNYFESSNWNKEVERNELKLSDYNEGIKKVVRPDVSIPLAIMYPISVAFTGFDLPKDKLVPIMAHPVYKEPVYEHVISLGKEFLVPNLHLIPDNSVTLMETNQRFIESFMLGLNHEMGKELLWRGYPTDQRGSYFRQFWNVADIPKPDDMTEEEFAELNYDISEIHTWKKSNKLGNNNNQDSVSNLVLVIRGELLRKYPHVLIYAKKGEWHEGKRRPVENDDKENYRFPIFKAEIEPDVYLVGFELEADDAKGSDDIEKADPGWFFVLQERPGEVRFGMDESAEDDSKAGLDPTEWNDLNLTVSEKITSTGNPNLITWYNGGHLELPIDESKDNSTLLKWGENSAVMAQILYQNPVMVCIHADDMINQN